MENKKKKVIAASVASVALLGTAAGVAVPLATETSKVKTTPKVSDNDGAKAKQRENIGIQTDSTVAVPRSKAKTGRPDLRIDTKNKNQLQHGVSADDKVIDTVIVDQPKAVEEPTIIPYDEQLNPLKRTGSPVKIDIAEVPTAKEMTQLTPNAPKGYRLQKTPFGDRFVPIVEQGNPVKTPPPAPKMGKTPYLVPEKQPIAPTLKPHAIPHATPKTKDINWIPEATMDIPLTSMEQAVTTHDKKQTPRDSKLYVPKTQGAHLEWKEQQARLARMTSAMKSMFKAETNQEAAIEARFNHHPFELKDAYEKAEAKFNAAEARYNIYLATAKKTEEMNLFFDAQTETVQNGEAKSVSQLPNDQSKLNEAKAEAAFNEERDRYNAHLEMERKTLAMTEFYGAQAEIANDLAKARMDHSFGYDNDFDKAEAKFNAERKAFEITNNKIADENIKNNVLGFEESVAAQTVIDNQEELKNIDEAEFNAQKTADLKAQEAKVAEAKARDAAEKLAIAEEAKARRTAEETQAASQVAEALASTEHTGITTAVAKARQEIILNAARRAAQHTEATVEAAESNGRKAAADQAAKELAAAKAEEAVATGNAIIARAKFEAEQQRIADANAAIAEKEAQSLKAEQDAIERSKADELKTQAVADNAELAALTVQAEETKGAEAQFKANTLQSNKDANAKRTFEAELNAEEEIAGVDATIRGDRNIYDSSLEAIKKQDVADQKAWEDQASQEAVDKQIKQHQTEYTAAVEASAKARIKSDEAKAQEGAKNHRFEEFTESSNAVNKLADFEKTALEEQAAKKAAQEAELLKEQAAYRKQYGEAMEAQQSAHDASEKTKAGTGDYQVRMQTFRDDQDIAKGDALDQQAAQEAAAWVKQQEAKISYTEPKTVISKQQLPPTTGYEVNGVVYATEQEAKTALDSAATVKQSWYIGSTEYDSIDELRKAADGEVLPLEEVELGKNGMQDGDQISGIPKVGRPETGFVYNGISYRTKAEAEAAWLAANPVVQTASGRVQQITINFKGTQITIPYKLSPGQSPLQDYDIRNAITWTTPSFQNGQKARTPFGYDIIYIPKGATMYVGDHSQVYQKVPAFSTADKDAYVKVATRDIPDAQMNQGGYNVIPRGAVFGAVATNKWSVQNPFGDDIYIECDDMPTVAFAKGGYHGYTETYYMKFNGKITSISSTKHVEDSGAALYSDFKISSTITEGTGVTPQDSAARLKAADAEIEKKLFTTASPDQGTEEKFLIPYEGFSKGWSYEGKFYHEKVTAETVRNADIDAQHHTYVTYVINGQTFMNKIAAYSQLIKRITVTDRSVFNHEVKAPSTSAGTLYK